MDDEQYALILGEIRGNMEGINRELKGIHTAMKTQADNCRTCRNEIDGRDDQQDQKIQSLQTFKADHQGGEKVKVIISDRTVGYGGLILACVAILATVVMNAPKVG